MTGDLAPRKPLEAATPKLATGTLLGAALALCLLTGAARATVVCTDGLPPPITNSPTWHLLTRSFSGTVSLIKGLTKEECEQARGRLLPHCPLDESIVSAECFE